MAESTSLLRTHTPLRGIEGSNPSLSELREERKENPIDWVFREGFVPRGDVFRLEKPTRGGPEGTGQRLAARSEGNPSLHRHCGLICFRRKSLSSSPIKSFSDIVLIYGRTGQKTESPS